MSRRLGVAAKLADYAEWCHRQGDAAGAEAVLASLRRVLGRMPTVR